MSNSNRQQQSFDFEYLHDHRLAREVGGRELLPRAGAARWLGGWLARGISRKFAPHVKGGAVDTSKLNRTVTLHCPTCAGTAFEQEAADSPVVRCDSCGLEITREDLQAANSENISAHVSELKRDAFKELDKEIRKRLQAAFRGNKFIKIR